MQYGFLLDSCDVILSCIVSQISNKEAGITRKTHLVENTGIDPVTSRNSNYTVTVAENSENPFGAFEESDLRIE